MKRSLSGWSVLALSALLCSPPARGREASLDVARALNQAFIDAAAKVSPSVVVISVTEKPSPPADNGDSDSSDGDSFDGMPPGFWRRFHEELRRQPEQVEGKGSGVIIRNNGYILTNGHVIENAAKIQVRFQDGRRLPATVQGVDPQSDLAVIKVNARGLPVAQLADSSQVKVGEFALAIGAPFSLEYTVTFGHISAKGRSQVLEGPEAAAMDQDFLQTDALINPGNSGGPLINIEGQVIGINTLIEGLHTGIGFAIPSNLAKDVSEQLIATGRFVRPWLGIAIQGLQDNPDLRDLIKGVDRGVVVSRVLENGPAAKSDLRASDVIVSVEGTSVNTPQQLRNAIRDKKIGQPLTLEVFRNGKTFPVTLSPREWVQPEPKLVKVKAPASREAQPPALGVSVEPLTPDLAERLGLDSPEGVVIASVDKNSPAARKGLKPGDVITAVNQQPTHTPKQFREALKQVDLSKGVLVNLVSGKSERFEILKAE